MSCSSKVKSLGLCLSSAYSFFVVNNKFRAILTMTLHTRFIKQNERQNTRFDYLKR